MKAYIVDPRSGLVCRSFEATSSDHSRIADFVRRERNRFLSSVLCPSNFPCDSCLLRFEALFKPNFLLQVFSSIVCFSSSSTDRISLGRVVCTTGRSQLRCFSQCSLHRVTCSLRREVKSCAVTT